MKKNRWFITVLVIVVCIGATTAPGKALPSARAQWPGPNLLVDGDFEAPPPWPWQDGIGEVQVAPGWRAWYLDSPPSYIQVPANCNERPTPDCYWMRPEFRDTVLAAFPNRVHGGERAQKYFSYGRMHEAGLKQRVTGITPGAVLRFSIYIQGWMCYEISKCGKYGEHSDAPSNMHLRVGIDPYGDTNPFSPNIIWSSEQEILDQWIEFSVQATAKADAVTVFTHSRPEWDWARMDNDIYLDDASLVQIGGPGAPPPQPQPTATAQESLPIATAQEPLPTSTAGTPAPTNTPGPTSTPAPTRTPRPDGAVIHIVQAGDTLSGIALQYDISLDELYSLNDLTRESILEVGQEIVVQVAAVTPTLPPTSTPSQAAPVTPTLALPTPTSPPPTDATAQSSVCLGAFEDANNNSLHDGGEPGLAGVTFAIGSVAGGSEISGQHITDNSGQLYCLKALPPGSYLVEVTTPLGYVAAFEKTSVELTPGQQVNMLVAVRRGEKSTATPAVTEQAQPTPTPTSSQGNTSLLPIMLAIVGLLIVIGAVVITLQRRPGPTI